MDGIELSDVAVSTSQPDPRPAFVLDSVRDADFHHVKAAVAPGARTFEGCAETAGRRIVQLHSTGALYRTCFVGSVAMTTRWLRSLPAVAVLLLSACRQPADPCSPRSGLQPPTSALVVVVTPTTLSLAPGEQGTARALVAGYDPVCMHFPPTIGWRISNEGVARVEVDTGTTTTVLAVASGTATLIARLQGDTTRAGAAVVTVFGSQPAPPSGTGTGR